MGSDGKPALPKEIIKTHSIKNGKKQGGGFLTEFSDEGKEWNKFHYRRPQAESGKSRRRDEIFK